MGKDLRNLWLNKDNFFVLFFYCNLCREAKNIFLKTYEISGPCSSVLWKSPMCFQESCHL